MSYAELHGLGIQGTADYDPGQPYPTASCGGVPPSWDVDVEEIWLDDVDEFHSTDIVNDLGNEIGLSPGVVDMIEAFHRITGTVLPSIEERIRARWEDELRDVLIDSQESGE